MENGIYFDLPEQDYHKLERLSASGICNMLVSPANFWAESWLNPDRKDDDDTDTPARRLGRAYHTARFEPELLNQKFVCELDPSEMEGALTNGTAVGAALAELGETKKKSGETTLDQAKRLASLGYTGKILAIEQELWEEDRGDRTPIAPEYWKQLRRDMELIRSQPDIAKHMTGGFAEVSVLWTDERTGIDMKCRFDYLKPDSFTDLKTFDNPMRKNLEQCLANAFQYNRYYVQAFLYWHVTELIRAKKVDKPADVVWTTQQCDLIDAIQARKSSLPIWYVFQQKGGVPNLLARDIHIMRPVHSSHDHNDAGISRETSEEVGEKTRRLSSLGMKAEAEVLHAMNTFNWYSESYERGQPWTPINPTGVINDDSFSPYWLGLDE